MFAELDDGILLKECGGSTSRRAVTIIEGSSSIIAGEYHSYLRLSISANLMQKFET